MKVLRYGISGLIATAANLILLFLFVEYAGLWYLIAAILAFILANGVSFLLQKYWTFTDTRTDQFARQGTSFFILGLFNLGINTTLMYVLVEQMGAPYLLAQILVSGIMALLSFFLYERFVFKRVD